jgi:hypothetical protein
MWEKFFLRIGAYNPIAQCRKSEVLNMHPHLLGNMKYVSMHLGFSVNLAYSV